MHLIILAILLLLGCTEDSQSYILNPVSQNLSYKHNFISVNPGENKYSISLSWSKYENYSNIICYLISNQQNFFEILVSETSTNDTTVQLDNLVPGNFYTVVLQLSPILDDTLITFTKPLDSITWAEDELGNNGIIPLYGSEENKLIWENSIDQNIESLEIYSFTSSSTHPNTINYSDNGDNTWTKIASVDNSIEEFNHSKDTFTDIYCYVIKSIDMNGNFKNSFITCDDNYSPSEPLTVVHINSASHIFPNKILIKLEAPYLDEDFDRYILWRSSEPNMLSNSKIILAYVTNPLQTIIDDRNDVIDKIYYYQLEIINQYGISAYSTIVQGSTSP